MRSYGISSNLMVDGLAGALPSMSKAVQSLSRAQMIGLSGLVLDESPGLGNARDKQPGRYYEFDGTNDHIALDSAITLSAGFSISAWISPDAVQGAIFDARSDTEEGVNFGLDGAGDVFLRIGANSHDSGFTLTLGQWYHVAATWDGSNYATYVDGILVDSGSSSEDVSAYDVNVPKVGRVAHTGVAHFNGSMADLRVKTGTVLTLSEIRELVTGGTDALANVDFALHYKMDDTHPTIAFDSSGNGNHGTKTSITANDFHAEGSDAPFSFENDKGYTPYLHFDGTDDDIPLPTAGVVENAAGAVSAWVVFDDFNGSASIILDIGGTGVNGLTFWSENNNAFKVFYGNGSINTQLANFTSDGATPHTLHHVLVRWSGSDIEAFLDGVSTDTASNFDPAIASYASKHIGSNAGSTRHAKGSVKDFWTFSNQLSDDDVAAIYAAGPGGSPSLAGTELFRMPLDDSDQKYWDTVSGTDHTPSSNAPTLIRAGRDESDKTKDWYGGTLAYSGECPSNGQLIDGNCAHMDGNDDYVEVADHADFDITDNLSGFIRCTNDNATLPAIRAALAKYDSGANKREWLLGVDGDEKAALYLGTSGGASLAIWVSDDAIDPSAISSLGFTFDGGVPQLYVDGLPVAGSVASGTIPTTLNNEDAAVTIGAQLNSSAGFSFWDGVLYDARIFSGDSAPLTAAQMLQLHNNEAESFSGQTNVLWLPMAEGGGDKHYDASGNGHDGDINGHTVNDYFDSTQPNFHYNAAKGFSKRQNKWSDSATTTGYVQNNATATLVEGPFGETNAIRLVPSDLISQTHRIYQATTAADGDYVVAYWKPYGTEHPDLAVQFTGGSNWVIDYSEDDVSYESNPGSFLSIRDVGDGWKRVALHVPSVNTGTLQVAGVHGSVAAAGAAWTPVNTTDGIDVFLAIVDDPETEPYPTTGTAITSTPNVPALADLSGDAVVSGHIQHAAGINRSESKIDLTGGVAYPTKNHAVRDNLLEDQPADWLNKTRVTVTTGQIEAPDGTYSAARVVPSVDDSDHKTNDEAKTVSGGATVTYSQYFKADENDWVILYDASGLVGRYFDLTNVATGTSFVGAPDSSSIESVKDGWVRCSITYSVPSTAATPQYYVAEADGDASFAGDASSGLYTWGAKCEEWHEATPYIDSDRSSENIPTNWELPVNTVPTVLFDNVGWDVDRVTSTAGQSDPDGDNLAFKLVTDNTESNGSANIESDPVTSKETEVQLWLASVKVKADEWDSLILLVSASSVSNRTQIDHEIGSGSGTHMTNIGSGYTGQWMKETDLGSGWYLVEFLVETDATNAIKMRIYPHDTSATIGDGSSGIIAFEPSLKRYYKNPLFHREITKNGILHRADRLTRYKEIMTGDRLDHIQDFTAAQVL